MVSLLCESARASLVCRHEGILCHTRSSGTLSSLWASSGALEGCLSEHEPFFCQDASSLFDKRR